MHEIDLDTAVREIVGTTRRKQDKGERLPFFFIVGAGISYPPIPLADGIEKRCLEEVRKLGGPPPPSGASAFDRYGASFKAAFPSAEDRQDFLHDLIDKQPISAANLRLAHLVGSGKLTNLVVTPNFDEMLSQALRLLGYHGVVVCDHPKTTQRIQLNRTSQIQIVHVHGTHWFYDCCNLRGEIEKRSEHDETDELSMIALVDKVLGDRSPLVIGYSGWEGDVIMTALKQRLWLESLPHNVYWFCYRREEVEALPGWLRDHPSVCMVMPPSPTTQGAGSPRQAFGKAEVGELKLGASRDLPAARAFSMLIQSLKLPEPPLTAEPLAFFGATLRINLEPAAAEADDIYLLREVFHRVERGVTLEASSRTAVGLSLAAVNDAVRRLDLNAAVEHAAVLELADLSSQGQEELDAALAKVIQRVDDAVRNDLGVMACEIRLRLAEVASRRVPDVLRWRERSARTLLRKGHFHYLSGDADRATQAWDEMQSRFGDSAETALRQQVAMALVNKGASLSDAQDTSGAITTFDDVVQRVGDSEETALRVVAITALFNKGVTLGFSHDIAGAISTYNGILHRFGDDTETVVREAVAKSLINKGVALSKAQDTAGEVAAYDEVLQRFGDATETSLRVLCAKALVNKGIALRSTQKVAGEIAAYDEVLKRFGAAPEAELREQVARALVNRGVAQCASQDNANGFASYDEVLQRFGSAVESSLREQVATALFNKGVTLGSSLDTFGEIAAYDEILRRFDDAREVPLQEIVAQALVNKGIALGTSHDTGGEIAAYDEAIERFVTATDSALRLQVAKALLYKGFALRASQETQRAIAAFNEIIYRFGADTEIELRVKVAQALLNKGAFLGSSQGIAGAIAAFDEVLQRFSNATETALCEQVAKALVNKGVALGSSQNVGGALAAYDEVLKRFGEATESTLREQVAKARYGRACALALRGQEDQALAELEGCLSRGEITRDHVRKDEDWTALRDDPRFQRLVAEEPEDKGDSSS